MAFDHWSSCALHNLPAYFPMPCNCGRSKGFLRDFVEVWRFRWAWKLENRASWWRFLRAILGGERA